MAENTPWCSTWYRRTNFSRLRELHTTSHSPSLLPQLVFLVGSITKCFMFLKMHKASKIVILWLYSYTIWQQWHGNTL